MNNFGCQEFTFDSSNRIYTYSGGLFDEAIINNLSKSGFKIEFSEPRDLTYMIDNITDAKAVIFVKK